MTDIERNRIKPLDGLRACAMILVLFSHSVWKFTDHIQPPVDQASLLHVFYNGWAGVELFFVLSGFLIASQLLKQRLSPSSYKKFALRRFFRIAPAYYCAILITLLYVHILPVLFYGHDVNLFETWSIPTLAHILFLHDYFGRHPTIEIILWSIPIEMKFYLLLPFIMYFLTKIRDSKRQLFSIVFFYIIYLISKVSYLYVHTGTEDIVYYQYFYDIKSPFHFALDGLTVGVFCAFFLNNAYIKSLQGHTKVWHAVFWVSFLAYFLVSIFPYFIEMRVDFFSRFGPRFLYALAFGGALIALVKGCHVSSFFSHSAFSYMARISYSTYLFQIFALGIQDAFHWKLFQYIESGFLCWIISLPFFFLAAGALGHLGYVYVEKPFIRWSKERWSNR